MWFCVESISEQQLLTVILSFYFSALLMAQIKEKCESELADHPSAISEAVLSYFEEFIEKLVSMRASVTSESSKHQERLEELMLRQSAVEERDHQVKEQQEQLAKERAKAEEEAKAEQAELARQWQQLRDEITRMEEVNSIQEVRGLIFALGLS